MQNFVITKDGMELQTKLVAGMTTALFTKISVSDYQYTNDELCSLTELVEVRHTVLVSSIERKEADQIEVIAAIGNAGLDNGYYIRALGLYAEDGEGNEVLYAVSISGDHPDYMPPCTDDALSEITYRMNIAVGSSDQVAIYVKPGAIPTVEQVEDIRVDVDELIKGSVCNLLYMPDAVNANSAGGVSWTGGRFNCSIPSASMKVWSGEIALPEGGYAFPASSDSADVIVVYMLDGEENQVEISNGAILPEGAMVKEYRLERKDGKSRIVADIWPMISPGTRPVAEYVPYTGDEHKINRCVAFVMQKFLRKDNVANNLVTTQEGYVLDARQGKEIKDEINGINADLSKISSDYLDINIPYHSANIIFIRVGRYCIAHIYHYVAGLTWDTEPYSIRIPDKYMPAYIVEIPNVTYLVRFYANGIIGLWGSENPNMEGVKEYGFAMYECAN